jgi:NAD(P)-dependent dehydrogenase (short-subunit alcohol dehydrogenase family)
MSQFNIDYTGKTVIVTGAAGGLGLALAQAFYANNANVVITDVNDARLASAPEQFAAEDREKRFLAVKADSSDEAQVEELIKKTVEKFGSLDVLVNNAAVNDDMEPTGDVGRTMWDLNIKVNLTAPYVTSKAAINEFLKKDGPQKGVILNVSSAAGMHGYRAGTTNPEVKYLETWLIYIKGLHTLLPNMALLVSPEAPLRFTRKRASVALPFYQGPCKQTWPSRIMSESTMKKALNSLPPLLPPVWCGIH